MNFGINLSFAIKRWPEPQAWARLVRETLGLDLVQFTYDLLDPWWPESARAPMAAEIRKAAQDWGIRIESAFSGLANYCFDGLLHPDAGGRQASLEWWKRAFDVAAAVGAEASGGPLGGLSVADSADPRRREERYRTLLDSVVELSEAARGAGLKRLQVECTPLAREIPYTVEQSKKFLADLEGRCAVPVKLLIDIGHALYQPLYGPQANMPEWLNGLGHGIGAFHLQNTDFQSDSHWGWPDRRGRFDVAGFARDVRVAGLDDLPAFLEIIYPFELADAAVLSNITTSVEHCRREYAGELLEKSHIA
ncbi:MAG: TIM barrel protein [Bryobacteraceae bacterium]